MDGSDRKEANLLECFGVVSSPLLEVAALLKAAEPRKWRSQCYAAITHNESSSLKALLQPTADQSHPGLS